MKVGELFMALGLFVDPKEWNLGEQVIQRMAAEMKQLAITAMLATTDVKKAAAMIGLPAVAAKSKLVDLAKVGGVVAGSFNRVARSTANMLGVGGIGQITSTIEHVVEMGGKLNDTAQKSGLSTDALQRLGHAATLNSSSFEDVNGAVIKLSRGFDDLEKKGQGPLHDALTKLGIPLNDTAVKSKNLEQLIFLIANKFSQMEDGAEKSAIAMKLFGKSGANLIPTLNQGVVGLTKAGEEAHEFGVVISKDAIEKLDNLGDDLDRTKAVLQGLKNQAVVALVPLLQQMVTQLLAWVKANRELINSTILELADALGAALKILGQVIMFVADHWRILAALLIAGAVVSGIMKVIRLITLFQTVLASAAVKAVASWVLMLGPIFWIAAAVVALGVLIYKYRDQVRAALSRVKDFFIDVGRSVKNFFSSVWQGIKDAADTVWTAIKDGFKAAFDFVVNLPVIRDLIKLVQDLMGLGTSVKAHKEGLKQLAERGQKEQERGERANRMRAAGMVEVGVDQWATPDEAKDRERKEKEESGYYKKMHSWDSSGKLYTGEQLDVIKEQSDRYKKDWLTSHGGSFKGMPNVTGDDYLSMGGATGAMATGVRASVAAGAGQTIIQNTTTVQINAANADAKEVGRIVDQKLGEADERNRRQTAAGLGVAP